MLLLTYLTLEKYICIVYPFRYLTPGRRRTVTILVAIWVLGFVIAFLPLVCKGVFRNFYGTNGVCFPLHSEQPETEGAQIYSIVIFLGTVLCSTVAWKGSSTTGIYICHSLLIDFCLGNGWEKCAA